MENPGLAYKMQDMFQFEGYFSMNVTPIGDNLCLIKEIEVGELKALVEEASELVKILVQGS